MARAAQVRSASLDSHASSSRSSRVTDALAIVDEQGLMGGGRTLTIRGRMPSRLVERAKKKTGIDSDSKLLEAAIASLVAADDYGDWLLAQAGTVSRDVGLEF